MLYKFLKYFFRCILVFLVKIEIINSKNIPENGSVLLASNHLSLWDPIILGVFVHRQLHFMAKEELFKIFLLGSIVRNVGAFPVKRGAADRNAIKEAIKILIANKALCIFPEGTRSKTGELLPFQAGVVLIAHKGNAPIVPISLKGTNQIFTSFKRARVQVTIGEPIFLEEYSSGKMTGEKLEEISNLIHKKVKEKLT